MPENFKISMSFGSAEELKAKREKEFLALTPDERFEKFLLMMQESSIMFGRKATTPQKNFIIEKKGND
jgi:hypothetical protein